jgi:hypothetical protein
VEYACGRFSAQYEGDVTAEECAELARDGWFADEAWSLTIHSVDCDYSGAPDSPAPNFSEGGKSMVRGGYRVLVAHDELAVNPWKTWNEGNSGVKLAAFGKFSHIGDDDAPSKDEVDDMLKNPDPARLVIPVHGLSHGGLRLSLEPFGDRWDSGVLGFFVVDRAAYAAFSGIPADGVADSARRLCEGAVKELNDWLDGDCYYVAVSEARRCPACGASSFHEVDTVGYVIGDEELKAALVDVVPDEIPGKAELVEALC